jgi:hypothetical protein
MRGFSTWCGHVRHPGAFLQSKKAAGGTAFPALSAVFPSPATVPFPAARRNILAVAP